MKTIVTLTAMAAVTALILSSAQAAPKGKSEISGTGLRTVWDDIGDRADSMSDVADQLAMGATRVGYTEAQGDALNALRSEVNQIGRDLAILEDENAVSAWERSTIDQVAPLMHEIASNTETAVRNFDYNRAHVWATGFPEQTARIYEEAARVKVLVNENLRLARMRDQEQRLESRLNTVQ